MMKKPEKVRVKEDIIKIYNGFKKSNIFISSFPNVVVAL